MIDDDAVMIAEKFTEISRLVIDWHFGAGTELLVEVALVKKQAEPSKETRAEGKEELENAVKPRPAQEDDGNEELLSLLQEGYADVAAVIEKALQADGNERAMLLQEAAAMLPEKIENEELDDAVTALLTTAFLGGG